jgi:hypothetical protein
LTFFGRAKNLIFGQEVVGGGNMVLELIYRTLRLGAWRKKNFDPGKIIVNTYPSGKK